MYSPIFSSQYPSLLLMLLQDFSQDASSPRQEESPTQPSQQNPLGIYFAGSKLEGSSSCDPSPPLFLHFVLHNFGDWSCQLLVRSPVLEGAPVVISLSHPFSSASP